MSVQQQAPYHSLVWINARLRDRVRAGCPHATGDDLVRLADAVIAEMGSEERELALRCGVYRILCDLLRAERATIIRRLQKHDSSLGTLNAPYLTLDDARALLDLCESYVVIGSRRQRAGSCSSDELRGVAAAYRERAADSLERAALFDRVAAEMDEAAAPTLDDLARKRES